MKNFIQLATIIVMASHSFAQAPTIDWQKSFGGSNEDSPKSIKQTADGGYIIAGSTKSIDNNIATHLDADNNPTFDYWVVKTNAVGTIIWQRTYGGSHNDFATTVIQTIDGGYIVGGETNSADGDVIGNTFGPANSHSWLLKLDDDGDIQWQRFMPIGQIGGAVRSVVETAAGGCVVAGNCYAVLGTFSYEDSYIVAVNPLEAFNPASVVVKGGGYHDHINTMCKTADGGYLLAGVTYSTDGDFSGNHGGWIGHGDIWVIKFSNTLGQEWQKLLGGTSTEQAFGVEQSNDGGYVIAGTAGSNDGDVTGNHGTDDFWLLKLNATGDLLWQKTLGGGDYDSCYALKKTTDGGFLLVGSTWSNDGDITNNYGNRDYWVVKTNGAGILQWQKNLGGSAYDVAFALDTAEDGSLIVAGGSQSITDNVTVNYGNTDFWIVKLSSENLSNGNWDKSMMRVYPNPSSSILNIHLPNQNTVDKIEISDLTGKKVLETLHPTNQINIEKLASGTYIIKAKNGETEYYSKVIKD